MTLRLYLIRHAKSDWGEPSLSDHDRPLNDRGRRSASALGNWLAQRSAPQEVLCSTARRTQDTWERMAPALPPAELRLIPELYHASPATLLTALGRATAPIVALIGHNPGIGAVAEALARSIPDDPRFLRYPTGATAVFEFAAERWTAIEPGRGTLTDFVVPRDLLSDRGSG